MYYNVHYKILHNAPLHMYYKDNVYVFGDGWWSPCPGHALLHPGLWGPARLRLAGRAGAAQHRRGGGMLDSSDFDGLTFFYTRIPPRPAAFFSIFINYYEKKTVRSALNIM